MTQLLCQDSTGRDRALKLLPEHNGKRAQWVLYCPESYALFGCEWLPLPLVGAQPETTVRQFVAENVR